MKRIARIAVLAAIVAGCSADGGQPHKPAHTPPPPPISLPPPPPISLPPLPPPDQCGAYELQGLVGKPRTEIPVPLNPARRRVVCSTCPKTMEFSPYRLTIEYDARTNLVTKVACN